MTRTTRCSQLMATPGAGGQGQFNLGSYSNAKVDELTKAIATETDVKKRNAMIAEAMKIHQDDVGHIPLHQQALAWAMKKNVDARAAGGQLHAAEVGQRERRGAVAPGRGTGMNGLARVWDSDVAYSFRNSPVAMVAALVAFVLIFSAVFARWVAPHNPFDLATINLLDASLPPSWEEGGNPNVLAGDR